MTNEEMSEHVMAWASKHEGINARVVQEDMVGLHQSTNVVAVQSKDGKVRVALYSPFKAAQEVGTCETAAELDEILAEQFGVVNEPEAEAEAEAEAADAGEGVAVLLEGSIADLEAALASGEWDSKLDELLAAETAGKDRKGAKEAIADRKALLAADEE